jgi:hypothetical protein
LQGCKFATSQVCNLQIKNSRNYKLQVCNFTSLHIYKIEKSRNHKLIITIYNLTNCKCACLQVQKFASLQVCKFANLQI